MAVAEGPWLPVVVVIVTLPTSMHSDVHLCIETAGQ